MSVERTSRAMRESSRAIFETNEMDKQHAYNRNYSATHLMLVSKPTVVQKTREFCTTHVSQVGLQADTEPSKKVASQTAAERNLCRAVGGASGSYDKHVDNGQHRAAVMGMQELLFVEI